MQKKKVMKMNPYNDYNDYIKCPACGHELDDDDKMSIKAWDMNDGDIEEITCPICKENFNLQCMVTRKWTSWK